MGQPPQQILLVPLLVGTDGSQKMSKSLNNQIGIDESHQEMYGKVMSIPDYAIIDYFDLVTDVPSEEIASFESQLSTHLINPMIVKKRLAYEIVKRFHSKQAADEGEQEFASVFQRREIPGQIPECAFAATCAGDEMYHVDIAPTLVQQGLVKSKSELRRLLAQGAIELDGCTVSSNIVSAHPGSILKIGKRNYVRIAIE
jgi:tyrosyl-tRNA synthetase